jgi:hypothetical protein
MHAAAGPVGLETSSEAATQMADGKHPPMPMMWLEECCRPSAHSGLPSQRRVMSSGTVEMRAS